MSEKWVDGSSRSGAFLDARDHLLQDAAAEAKFGFNLAHAWKAAQQGLLLDNTAVFLTPGTHQTQLSRACRLALLCLALLDGVSGPYTSPLEGCADVGR